jgi:hypothetical protein
MDVAVETNIITRELIAGRTTLEGRRFRQPARSSLRYASAAVSSRRHPKCERRAKPSSPDLAAWIVFAGGLDGIARGIENTGQAGTRFANGADFLR